jgi:hypothetical protein
MITGRSLWATYAHALNDESEIRCGTGEVKRTIEALSSPSFLHEPCLKALDIDHGYWSMMAVPFVTSFCATESSAHWLHYGRSGTGVAVVFSSQRLAEHPGSGLFRVMYDAIEQQRLIGNILTAVEEACDQAVRQFPAGRDGLLELAVHVAHTHLMIAAALMKEPSFRGEDKWRLVHLRGGLLPTTNVSDPQFRCSDGRLRPYVEVSWPEGTATYPYRYAMLGHSCREDDLSPSLRALFWFRANMIVDRFRRSTVKVRP